ncbi:SRPBCC family protein [Streptomyces zingiberis]|uniref:SRPBCC family protein n=1 Tax=Streptomyces zingiberis TaxID=2053010 RepID=A0ABX1BV55_9ACTN|nr:SRPBCC family protein [Streptomyces zingiberis]NJQ00326.1 SRPBCC family protein [Streptomyces zingiberis]
MAVRHTLIRRPPEAVWAVLSDGDKYDQWVVGPDESDEVDSRWPAPGSSIRYTVRVGPWSFQGHTVVRVCERNQRLELEVESGPLGTARVAIELRRWGDDCLVLVDEHPLTGPGAKLHSMATDAFLQLRHRSMLARLDRVVRRTTDSPGHVAVV